MPRAIVATTLAALLLASCQDGPGAVSPTTKPDCGTVVDAPTNDTMIGARIDGRDFLVPSTAQVGGLFLDTTRHQFTILANSTNDGPLRMLQVWFTSFHGVGTYSIAYGPYGGALYECDGALQHGVASKGDGSDSARVTAYDSVTGHIEGTFSFLGSPLSVSGDTAQVAVTNGVFNGTLRKLAVSPAPTCAEVAHVPTPDTLIGASIDGRPFLAPSAAPNSGIFLDTTWSKFTGTKLTLLANMVDDGHPRNLQVWFSGFHGAGAYSIGYNGDAGAIYECDGAAAHGFATRFGESGTDSVWVTRFDSATGRIEGRFGFVATPLSVSSDSAQVNVTNGTFRGTVTRSVPMPLPTCADYSSEPTSDTLISAQFNGRTLLIPGATAWSRLLLDTVQQKVTILGAGRDGGPFRLLQVWFAPFHGVGAYSIAYSTLGGGIFHCAGAAPYGFWSDPGTSSDSAWVTSYDSTTGQVEGTFGFQGYPLGVGSGAPATVTGRFHGTLERGTYAFAPRIRQ